jgi:hypothetical protein
MKKMNRFDVHMPSEIRNEQAREGPRTPNGIHVTVTMTGIVTVTATRNLSIIIGKKRKTRRIKIA